MVMICIAPEDMAEKADQKIEAHGQTALLEEAINQQGAEKG